jgi:site-specific DNA-methyltransferase (adenine-specific)
VIGTYHNIYRVGAIMQDLGFWFLNDVVWIKTNPMPNFHGVRLANAHETILWASKFKGARYTFNHHALRSLNDDLQMRSDWVLPICPKSERLRENGEKSHPTQKPESLLYRVISAASRPGDVVLDPFFGTGTSGAVAKKMQRNWIGIERDERYIRLAQQRIDAIPEGSLDESIYATDRPRRQRLPFGRLLEVGLLQPGQELFFRARCEVCARVRADARLILPDGRTGSIHQLGSQLMDGSPCNGWEHWYFTDEDGGLHPLDDLRRQFLESQP